MAAADGTCCCKLKTATIVMALCVLAMAAALLVLRAMPSRPALESPLSAGSPNPSKAPWYELSPAERLVYLDPWLAGVLYPAGMITGGAFAVVASLYLVLTWKEKGRLCLPVGLVVALT